MTTYIERPRFSCALGGALATIGSLPRVVPIIHAAAGCGGNLSNAIAFGGGYYGSGYCGGQSVPTSGVTETEIVFGGAERLTQQIDSTREIIDADLFVVTTGCMTELIGDDIGGVVSQYEDGVPVIAVNTPSFQGNSYRGYELVLEGIFLKHLPKVRQKQENLVNIFGLIPGYDPFFRGDLTEIARVLARLGLQVNTFFTPDQSFENLTSAPGAALNILLSNTYGRDFVERFERRHEVPYLISELPIGPQATDSFLRRVAQALSIPQEQVERVIEEENRGYYAYFERTADMYADGDFQSYAVVVGNANSALSAAAYVEKELGWLSSYVFITDALNEYQQEHLTRAWQELGVGGKLIFETNTARISEILAAERPNHSAERYYDSFSPLFVLGSTLEKDLASRRGARYLPISYPVYNRIILDRGYAGYRGGLHLFEDILDVFVAGK